VFTFQRTIENMPSSYTFFAFREKTGLCKWTTVQWGHCGLFQE
jgi:hypothetical protein